MPVNDSAKGKTYPAHVYEVGKEKIGEYAEAVGEDNPVYFDRDKAREAGFRDVVAPPMFAVVYSWRTVWAPAFDSEVGMDVAKLLHASQEFTWGEPVCAGDVITTELTVADIYPKGPNGFYVFETVSTNQDGAEVARGTWTNIVRGAAEE
jgi:acyl dehydratase